MTVAEALKKNIIDQNSCLTRLKKDAVLFVEDHNGKPVAHLAKSYLDGYKEIVDCLDKYSSTEQFIKSTMDNKTRGMKPRADAYEDQRLKLKSHIDKFNNILDELFVSAEDYFGVL